MKTAKNLEEAWSIEEKYNGSPHCWVQWKGTDVCMDFHCDCGESSHIDSDFTYAIKCPSCRTSYACNDHIELIKLDEEPDNVVIGEKEDW